MPEPEHFDPEQTLATGQAGGGKGRVLKVGDIVGGSYKIKGVIGRGGMGVVYEAEQIAVQRQVALKALAPEKIDEDNWRRFQNEGRAISRLDHQNIVKVFDLGSDGSDCLYYVMDLLHGISLAEYIKEKGVLGLDETIDYFLQICAGLGYAHKQGLVHRDIKPNNIILCPEDKSDRVIVKIIDFGLVKQVDGTSQFQQSQTATGIVYGSPLFMSPEQCMGMKVDARSDIYSLGVSLFQCLTGELPFRGKTAIDTALMHQREEPPLLRDWRPDKNYSDSLENVVRRMLAKTPIKRYQSLDQVAQDLMRIREGKTVNIESVFIETPALKIDHIVENEQDRRKLLMPVAVFCAVVMLVGVFAFCLRGYFTLSEKTQADRDKLINKTSADDVNSPVESADVAHARQVFASCPAISAGVVQEQGSLYRVFNFPSVPVGTLHWGRQLRYNKTAQGQVFVPAREQVFLLLSRPTSQYTRLFPQILKKIGPQDIYGLEVQEPDAAPDDGPFPYQIPVELINDVVSWKALRVLVFYCCALPKDTVMALNQLTDVEELNLRDCVADGGTLAKVKWLNKLKKIDVRGMAGIDEILTALANDQYLMTAGLDRTSPSVEALANLISCKNLHTLSLSESEIDDNKLPTICKIESVSDLNLKRCNLTSKSVQHLYELKNLRYLNLSLNQLNKSDIEELQKHLPDCKITCEMPQTKPQNIDDL